MRQFIIIALLTLIIGCTGKGRNFSGIISKEKMEIVMWDLIQADVFTEQFIKKDTTKNAVLENMQLQNKIFSIHNITKADYYKSYEYYITQSGQMKQMLDSMTAKAERNRTKMHEQHAGSSGPQPVK